MTEQPKEKPIAGTPTNDTIKVGCKLPSGMLLELGARGDAGYRNVQLRGSQSKHIALVSHGFGITEVPRDFWDKWFNLDVQMTEPTSKRTYKMKANQQLPFIKNGMVFVAETKDELDAKAFDKASEKSGFERLSQKDRPKGITLDPEMEKSIAKGLDRQAEFQSRVRDGAPL